MRIPGLSEYHTLKNIFENTKFIMNENRDGSSILGLDT